MKSLEQRSARPLKETQMISAGVKNLKDYGYPHVSADNILTDHMYSAFFKSMLEDNRGKGADHAIDALLKEIAQHQSEP